MIIGKFGPFSPGQKDCRVFGDVVHFGIQNGHLFVWAQFKQVSAPRDFAIIATGEELEGKSHFSSVITPEGLV